MFIIDTFSQIFIILLLVPIANANSKHVGDTSVGGVHFFEFHSTHGGTGLGIKIILAVIVIGGFLYWAWSRLAQHTFRREITALGLPTTMVASAIAQQAPLAIRQPPQPQPAACQHNEDCMRIWLESPSPRIQPLEEELWGDDEYSCWHCFAF